MLAEAQFALLKSQSQVSVKEGTSHFQGIALTNSELNNFNTATLGNDAVAENPREDNKENNQTAQNCSQITPHQLSSTLIHSEVAAPYLDQGPTDLEPSKKSSHPNQ